MKEEKCHRNNKSSVLGEREKQLPGNFTFLVNVKKRVKDLEKYGESSVEEITSGNPTPGDRRIFQLQLARWSTGRIHPKHNWRQRIRPIWGVLSFWSKRIVLYWKVLLLYVHLKSTWNEYGEIYLSFDEVKEKDYLFMCIYLKKKNNSTFVLV